MKVRDIMTPNPIVCIADDSALDAAFQMKIHSIGSLPVVSGITTRRLVGMVTDRDLCMAVIARGFQPQGVFVRSAMTRDPIACGPEATLEYCAQLMEHAQVRRIPVIDKRGAVVGIVAQADLVKHANPELLLSTLCGISEDRLEKGAVTEVEAIAGT